MFLSEKKMSIVAWTSPTVFSKIADGVVETEI